MTFVRVVAGGLLVSVVALSGCCTPDSAAPTPPTPTATSRAVPWLNAFEQREGRDAARVLAGSILRTLIDLEASSVRASLPVHSGPDSFAAEEILTVMDAYPDADPRPDLSRVPWVRARLSR